MREPLPLSVDALESVDTLASTEGEIAFAAEGVELHSLRRFLEEQRMVITRLSQAGIAFRTEAGTLEAYYDTASRRLEAIASLERWWDAREALGFNPTMVRLGLDPAGRWLYHPPAGHGPAVEVTADQAVELASLLLREARARDPGARWPRAAVTEAGEIVPLP